MKWQLIILLIMFLSTVMADKREIEIYKEIHIEGVNLNIIRIGV